MPGCIEGNIRILLDHNLPRQLAGQLPACAVSTARADLVDAILRVVKRHKLTQKQLARILDDHQPKMSDLMTGKIAKFTIDRLLRCADTLGIETTG
jgi:predicted XRE-type DNA-binding protein